MNRLPITLLLITLLFSCTSKKEQIITAETIPLESPLKNYDSLAFAKVMVLGTFHFSKDMLEEGKEDEIIEVIEVLAKYQPTKIVLEWEPSMSDRANRAYQLYLKDSFDISIRENEVFQLGFRMAQELNHDSLFMFDNQTEYLGSLDNFSFDSFGAYAKENDDGFYNKYEEQVSEVFSYNQHLLENLSFIKQLSLLNSPEAQRINAQRMHMYEVRVGIQKNWIGPDWLGRWYQRNIRMMANVLKFAEKQDRILIIVGDNHKWTLDMLFENTPDFEVVSSYEFLN